MQPNRPKIIFCQRDLAGSPGLVEKAELGGCDVVRTSSLRSAIESAMTGVPSAIFCETVVDDGTATMLFDMIEKVLPRPNPPIFVMTGATRELHFAQRRGFSGVLMSNDSTSFERIILQVSASPFLLPSPFGRKKTSIT